MLTNRQSIILLIAISFFLPLGLLPLFDLDEGAFSEATREMLLSGNYITTYLEGKLRFDKPILIYWCQAISAMVFGINEWAFRLPSAIATVAWAHTLYQFCKQHFDQARALTCIILFISCLHINIIGKAAISDALLNLWITSSMLSLCNFLLYKEEKHLLIFYCATGLGILTKGPIALLIPIATTLLYCIIRQDQEALKTFYYPKGILCLLAICLPWYICEYIDQGQLFINGFFLKHNLGRFATPMEKHHGSLGYYIPIMLCGLMPFTGIYLHACRYLHNMKNDALHIFMYLWFGFVFIFFSLAATKLHHYIIYGYPPLFIIASAHSQKIKNHRWISYPALIIFSLLITIPWMFEYNQHLIKDAYIQQISSNILTIFSPSYQRYLSLCAIAGLCPWFVPNNLSIHSRMLITGLFFSISINYIIAPRVAKIEQKPIKNAARYIRKHPQKVIPYKINTPSFSVYSKEIFNYKVPSIGDTILLRVNQLGNFNHYKTLFKENGIYLIKLKEA